MDSLLETELYKSFEKALDKSDWQHALKLVESMLLVFPNHPLVHFCRGEIFRSLDQWDDAISAYQQVHILDDKLWDPSASIGGVKLGATFAVECSGARVAAWMGLGMCYRQCGMLMEAIAAYQSCLAENPDYPVAQQAISEIQAEQHGDL